jgi:hypothetical protein
MRLARAFCFIVLVLGGPAFAGGSYLDNRSGAAEVVRSLYDAISRKDYARAYSYFEIPPAKDFATYEKGFDGTVRVDVITGEVFGDGAAGSIFYAVPTALKSTDSKGVVTYFAGCYTVRGFSALAQEPPFRPLQITKGSLKPAKADDYQSAFLPKCGEGDVPDPVADSSVEKAKAMFVAGQQGLCDKVEDTRGGANEPNVFKFKYKDEGAGADDPERILTLFAFSCSLFAYNASTVFYAHDDVEGMHLLSFAAPQLAIKHPEGDDEGTKLQSMKVKGFKSSTTLINADIDQKKQTITEFNKWRGVGDASSNGVWTFDKGEFVLTDFDVDPTYDEKINPIKVIAGGKVQ